MAELKIRKHLVSVEEILHEGGPGRRQAASAGLPPSPSSAILSPALIMRTSQLFMDDAEAARTRHGATAYRGPWRRCESDRRLWQGAPSSERPANSSTARSGMCPAAMPCASCWATPRPSCPRPRKSAAPGTRIDVPVTHINASYVRSHFDAMEVGIAGRPARQ